MSAALTDLGFSEYVCQSREGEGLGYTNVPTFAPGILARGGTGTVGIDPGFNPSDSKQPSSIVEYNQSATFSPIIAPQFSGSAYQGYMAYNDAGSNITMSNCVMSGLSGGNFQSSTNWVTYPFNKDLPEAYTGGMGRALCVRS